MTATLLTINSLVPYRRPGSPTLIAYDHGDFEVAFLGDVSWIKDTATSEVVVTVEIAEVLSAFNHMLGEHPILPDSGVALLFMSSTVDTGAPGEPVFTFTKDGNWAVTDRVSAEAQHARGDIYQFIAASDILGDVREFVSYHRDDMFDEDDA